MRALKWLVTAVGIGSIIESFWERRSVRGRQAAARSGDTVKQAVYLAILALSVTACTSGINASATQPRTPSTECATFDLAVDLPSSPANADVYWQAPVDTTLDTARASVVARRLGIVGSTSSYVGEGGAEVFVASDRNKEVTVFSDVPLVFTYSSNPQPLTGTPPSRLYPMQELASIAEDFLHEHSLLDFKNRIESAIGTSAEDYSVRVVPLVSGVPLFENDPTTPRIWVVLNAEGTVWHLFYDTLRLEAVTELPLRQAAVAWGRICLGGSAEGLLYTTYDTSGRIDSTRGHIPVPGEEASSTDLPDEPGHVDHVGLVYYAFDLRLSSANAYPPDSPVRFVQPVWRFAGHLDSGEAFDILAPALEEGALASLVPPS